MGRQIHTVEDARSRFMECVEVVEGDHWFWQMCKTVGDYGRVNWKAFKDTSTAHRLSWTLFKGRIPEGKCVLHDPFTCNIPRCVNPVHLHLGDMQQNNIEAALHGTLHKFRTTTNEEVRQIRDMYDTVKDFSWIGELFGISRSTARKIALHQSRIYV